MNTIRGQWPIETALDAVRLAAQIRNAVERFGADADRQAAIFSAVLDATTRVQAHADEVCARLELRPVEDRQARVRVSIEGKARTPEAITPVAGPGFDATTEMSNLPDQAQAGGVSMRVLACGSGAVLAELEQTLDNVAAPSNINELQSVVTAGFEALHLPQIAAEFRRLDRAVDTAQREAKRSKEELFRLGRELEETNRGVVALYAELDERADELRRADRAKSRFLSNVSHELRTPLNSIRALARLLLDRLDGPLNEEQLKQVAFIHTAAGELRQTVDDLLDIAKIAAGRSEVHVASFEIAELFGALRGTLKPLLSGNAVRLHFEEASGLPAMTSDEAKIAQILRNLVSNALKFTESGEVRVTASQCLDGRTIRFEVADTGIGIAPDDRERIFEEFVQIANPLQVNAKGTGLGLPLCRRLAALLGGSILVDSTPGKGSTFAVMLPRVYMQTASDPQPSPDDVAAPAPKAGATTTRASETAPLRVLLIDDDPAARYAVRRRLEEVGASIDEAGDGASGLDVLVRTAPHLVVLDLQLPDMPGPEVLRRLRALPGAKDLPVAVLTSLELDDRQRAQFDVDKVIVLSKKAVGDTDFCQRLLNVAAPNTGTN